MDKKNFSWLLPVRSILFLLIFLTGASITGKKAENISNWWSIIASVVNILTIAMLVMLARRSGRSYSELINYRKGRNTPKQVILIALVVAVIGMGGMYLSGFICYGAIFPKISLKMIEPLPAALAVINMLILPLTVPFAEDGLYLGCGVSGIKNKTASVMIPAFFYAFQHCFIPVLFDAKYMVYRFLSFLPLTVFMCMHYRKNKDPMPLMVGHAVLDMATVSMILMTSVSPDIYEKLGNM